MAEFDRFRVAAVLTTDSDLKIGFGLPSPFNGDLHQSSDPFLIEDFKGVVIEDLPFIIEGEKFILRVLSRKGEGCLREIVGPKGEEVSHLRNPSCPHTGPDHLDHRPKFEIEFGLVPVLDFLLNFQNP